MDQALKTQVHDGQRFMDRPVYVKPKLVHRNVVLSLCGPQVDPRAFELACFARPDGRRTDQPARDVRVPMPILVRYERIRLRWMQPDGNGGLVPRRGPRS